MRQAGMNQADTNKNVREDLSAGVDGEVSKEQLRFLLRRIDHDASLQQAWTRYSVARDSLRRQLPPLASPGFATRVMQAIEQEAVPVAANRRHHRWLRWSAGGAIAASVAVAALMVAQPTGDTGRNASTALTAQVQTRAVARTVAASQPATPAAVPPWLSGKAPGLLSQRASATLGAPADVGLSSPYGRELSPFRVPRYRTLDNHDGSYLILLDPARQQVPDAPRQGAVSAQ